MITIKRIYDPYSEKDGYRVLVDRLWPRGISKERAHLDLWLKEIAPDTELRKWFGHDPQKWSEFKQRYLKKLSEKKELVMQLKKLVKEHATVTLLYGARDTEHNEAVILLQMIQS